MRRNPDEDLRKLERSGNLAKLAQEQIRRGRIPLDAETLKAFLTHWLKEREFDYGVRFWLPDEWTKKGERFGNKSGLVMTSEGGWNRVLDGEYNEPELYREWDKILASAGWEWGNENGWAFTFSPVREKRFNSDAELGELKRAAGLGDPGAARKLTRAYERLGMLPKERESRRVYVVRHRRHRGGRGRESHVVLMENFVGAYSTSQKAQKVAVERVIDGRWKLPNRVQREFDRAVEMEDWQRVLGLYNQDTDYSIDIFPFEIDKTEKLRQGFDYGSNWSL